MAGLSGAILVVALSDSLRYLPVLIGQRREQVSFLRQDLAVSLFMFTLLGLFTLLRAWAGYGTAFDGFLS
jgi:hypothetical protein